MPPKPKRTNAKFLDEVLSFAVDIDRFSAATELKIRGVLKGLEQELSNEIERLRNEGATDSARFRRAEKMFERTRNTISSSYSEGRKVLTSELVDLSSFSRDATIRMIDKVIGGSVATTSLTPQDLRSIASNVLVQGAPQKDWWAEQSAKTRGAFEKQVRIGLVGGETNDQIVQRVRGKATGRRSVVEIGGKRRVLPEFQGGVMNVSTRDAKTLVRTSVQSVSNNVLMQTYRDNDDLISGVQAVVTLDNATTEICISRDGGMWNIKTGDPLPGSARDEIFPGEPPWHMRCRSSIAPITRSWADIVEEASGKRLKLFEVELGDLERAAMGGPVSGKLGYEGWLKGRSEKEQIDILGRGKHQLWKDGKISLSQLTDNTGRPLTIAQLREKHNLVKPVPK